MNYRPPTNPDIIRAKRQAEQINAYWRRHGIEVYATVDPCGRIMTEFRLHVPQIVEGRVTGRTYGFDDKKPNSRAAKMKKIISRQFRVL